jgi:CubicO group peptidase (beta-lactamase class C family)
VLTYRDEIIWSWNAGYRSVSPPQSVDSHTRFRVASVSKAFTATALFKLVAERILPSVDSKIVDYESGFAVRNPFAVTVGEREGRDLTFRALAAHLSGLQREAPCLLSNCTITTASLLPWFEKTYLVKPPNQKPSYSNLGYALLGNLLADSVLKGGKGNYADMMKTFVFDPLGMNETGFYPSEQDAANFALGYIAGQAIPYYSVDWMNPSAGLSVFPGIINFCRSLTVPP